MQQEGGAASAERESQARADCPPEVTGKALLLEGGRRGKRGKEAEVGRGRRGRGEGGAPQASALLPLPHSSLFRAKYSKKKKKKNHKAPLVLFLSEQELCNTRWLIRK